METNNKVYDTVWRGATLHVDWFDTYSNLHFVLDHPWRRFSLEGEWPPTGRLLLLTAGQERRVASQEGEHYQALARSKAGRTQFVLVRVLSAPG